MTTRTFAPWVEPVAAKLRASRGAIVDLAQRLPDDAWSRPSPIEGWSYKDLLAHLAIGDWVCQTIVGAVVNNEALNLGFLAQLDERNERYRLERLDRPVAQLIAEVRSTGEKTQDLLSGLTDADESRTQEGARMTLGHYLTEVFPSHDPNHLEHLRSALNAG